mmetsp:Transcript_1215/g.3157  ORF Transcript_1215/g.3157 Transcript_1215/m.3157 type:complete len:609 (+) Transcript_1215:135-1961(+)
MEPGEEDGLLGKARPADGWLHGGNSHNSRPQVEGAEVENSRNSLCNSLCNSLSGYNSAAVEQPAARGCCGWCALLVGLKLLALGLGAFYLRALHTTTQVHLARPRRNETTWEFGSMPDIKYSAWPPPQTARSAAMQRALCEGVPTSPWPVFGERTVSPELFSGAAVARRLHDLGKERDRAVPAQEPPILILAGGNSALGLGNIFSGLAAAAVLAEALGAACLVSLGDSYAKTLLEVLTPKRTFAFPCQIVSESVLRELRTQMLVPVVRAVHWRAIGMFNATGDGTRPTGGAYVIDFTNKYRQLGCVPRPDGAKLLLPPGMAPGDFWRRLRSKFEEWIHVSLTLPPEPHELKIDARRPPWGTGTGTMCGHLRLLHVESHRGRVGVEPGPSCSLRECGSVISAMEAFHTKRPFPSYFLASGADCSHCWKECAPSLSANASRIESGHTSAHILKHVNFDDAIGAIADMRALAKCAVVVADDKYEGTFALSLAAAGRLTPCLDPLQWVERWQPGLGNTNPSLRRSPAVSIGQRENLFKTRVLCATDDPEAPVTPPPAVWDEGTLRDLQDSVRFDLSRLWDPVLLPPPGAKPWAGKDKGRPYVPEACLEVLYP